MERGKVVVAVGIGCRKECSAEEIIELIDAALEKNDRVISDVGCIATAWMKEKEKAIINAADALDIPFVAIPEEECKKHSHIVQTVSQKVVDLFAVPSVSEVAALAAAGKNAKLVCERVNSANASCAIAIGEE